MRPCLIGMDACVGEHPLSRKLESLGHGAGLVSAKKPFRSSLPAAHDRTPINPGRRDGYSAAHYSRR
jgi:hypothetical protein